MAGKDANIIRLDASCELPPPDEVPAQIIPVRTQTIDYIRHLLPPLFDQADDTLFMMSGHATLHGEQTLLFDGMRTLRVQKQAVSDRFLSGLARWFEPGKHLNEGESEQALTEVRSDNLALVGEEDLEEQLAIAGLLDRVQHGESGKQLKLLNNRLTSLYQLDSLALKNSPVGPVAAGRVFLSALQPLELPLKVRLVVLKIFEQSYLSDIENFYRKTNNELRDQGVCPELEKELRQQRAQATREANGCDKEDSEQIEEPSEVDNPIPKPEPSPVSTSSEPAKTNPVASSSRPNESTTASELEQMELMELLSVIQSRQPEIEEGGIVPASPSLRETMDIALAGVHGKKALNLHDNELIDMVSMLFEFIMDDHELSAHIKSLIGRLQVPVLKLAIIDKQFLSKRSHPARQLLNGLASAGTQVLRQGEAQGKRLGNKVEQIVSTILREFATDISLFERALKSFEEFLQQEKQRLGRLEKRQKKAEEARNRSEMLRVQVQDTLDHKLKGQDIPKKVMPLVYEAWGSYLFITALKKGDESTSWERALRVVDHIVASLQPLTPDSEQRRRAMLPKLYETIELALKSITYDPCLTELYLKELKSVHSALIKNVEQLSQNEDQLLENVAALEQISESKLSPHVSDAPSLSKQPSDNHVEKEPLVAPQKNKPAEAKSLVTEPAKANFNELLNTWQNDQDDKPESSEELFDEDDAECIVLESVEGDLDFSVIEDPVVKDDGLSDLAVGDEVIFAGGEKDVRFRLAEITHDGRYLFENANGLRVAEKSRSELRLAVKKGVIKLVSTTESKGGEAVFDRALKSVIGNFKLFGDKK
ncbi:DUF1631 family protein [Parendozoicomonas haliclonae]|uniref:Thymidine phosphorylase n=1 Tax=Parendozoicomonas haliclonae TaxID=1960125 RepID=A0A1X7ANW2_9GAMM|nr:DUF1631 family protein [Parendozoicomonas haliclonae]SMA49994.1 hypothetical protein EHSB41UT_03785 [Parendozoicomonas haliclonae]